MTAPSSGRDDATLRGAVVLIVAIVIGLALLARSGGGGDDEAASSDRDTTTTTEASGSTDADGSTESLPVDPNTSSTTTAPPSTQDPASITVAVLNATPTVGFARDKADILASAGYQTAAGNFNGDNQDTTTIYATPEAQADANAIKTLLGLGGASVVEKGEETLGRNGEDSGADVVVVLGADSGGEGGATEGDDAGTDTSAEE